MSSSPSEALRAVLAAWPGGVDVVPASALDVGLRTSQHSDRSLTAWYKILEKDPARALEDAQKTKIKDNAYTYWLQQQKKAHGVQKLVPGHELDG